MKSSLLYRLFFISLFFTSCPSIFTDSVEKDESQSVATLQLDQEAFEQLMICSREHTQEIGWCCQQIIQTLCNNKEQYLIQDKETVIETLKKIQALTQEIDLHILSKNTLEALTDAIYLNQSLIQYLTQMLTSKFKDCNFKNFIEQIQKRSITNLSIETIISTLENNSVNLKTLLNEIGTTGLTWYNLFHRKMKEYNIYNIAKKTFCVGAGIAFLATLYCASGRINPDGGWLDRWIGTAPIKNPLTGKYQYETHNPNYTSISDSYLKSSADFLDTIENHNNVISQYDAPPKVVTHDRSNNTLSSSNIKHNATPNKDNASELLNTSISDNCFKSSDDFLDTIENTNNVIQQYHTPQNVVTHDLPHNALASLRAIHNDQSNKDDASKLLNKRFNNSNNNTSYPTPNNPVIVSDKPLTIFQSTVRTLQSLHERGMATIAPLFTVNLAGICSYCFGDSWSWTKNKYNETTDNLDKFLNGSQPNKNLNPDGQEKVYFQDLVGCEELEALANQLANFVEHPEYYERSKTECHRGILLYGPPQTGKSNFAKALRTLIQDRLKASGINKEIGFIDGKAILDSKFVSLEEVFYIAEKMSPCILFFDEIDLIGGNREKAIENTGILLSKMQGMDSSKQVIVIGATNRIEELDKALLVDGRFGKQFFIDYPEYKYRKQFLMLELEKRAIEISNECIDHIAQETEGCSYNNLRRIITESIIASGNERRLICEADFNKTLDREVRKIYFGSRNKSTQKEKEIIAAYQAGKAILRHILSTDRQIVKITIEDVARSVKPKKTGYAISLGEDTTSDNQKLAAEKNETKIKFGEVFTTSTTNKTDFISDEEMKKESLVLLAGNIAQQCLLGQNYGHCNKHDRADAMQLIYDTIAQGEKINDKIRAEAIKIKEKYEEEIRAILEDHKDALLALTNLLVEHTTIDRYQWATLTSEA